MPAIAPFKGCEVCLLPGDTVALEEELISQEWHAGTHKAYQAHFITISIPAEEYGMARLAEIGHCEVLSGSVKIFTIRVDDDNYDCADDD
jgi:hypothetical protein